MPNGMIARAEGGEYQRAAGRGYAEAPSPYLPFMASAIITNNVQVAFGAFALGITAGIGTVLVLVFNGLFFGAVLGLFANYHLAGWILTFVAGHGVLELTAIFIAGGAGLLVGRALVAPGDLARRDALVVHGRLAIRLVGAAACLLILAGLIEGFLSASGAPRFLSSSSAWRVWCWWDCTLRRGGKPSLVSLQLSAFSRRRSRAVRISQFAIRSAARALPPDPALPQRSATARNRLAPSLNGHVPMIRDHGFSASPTTTASRLPNAARLAKGTPLCPARLQRNKDISQVGDVRSHRTASARCGISTCEHRGGLRQAGRTGSSTFLPGSPGIRVRA